MAQTVKLKRSNTADNVPTTAQLASGELAMNTRDGKIFMRKYIDGTDQNDTIIDPIDAAAASDHSHTGATADDVIAMAIALG
jgi:hypothetical protein|tara:strand:+ start:304 stop:549 length:246 start_codon:yes stop_codon:yes gene_type:complete